MKKNRNIIKKSFILILSIIVLITMVPVNVFATEVVEMSTSIVESFFIDKTLMSQGETATITIQVAEGYTAKWIYFYKPITNNTEVVSLSLISDNVYTGTFTVDDQTESGVWKVEKLTLKDATGEWEYLYNSNTYTQNYYTKVDFSGLNFEVVGTDADVTKPVIESYSINKTVVSSGETISLSAKIIDEHLPSTFYLVYRTPGSKTHYVTMKKVDDTGLYHGTLPIDFETELGLWKPDYFYVSDTNDNTVILYNSNLYYGTDKIDFSVLNFEVIDVNNGVVSPENSEMFIVIFKDGYGNTLSTQRVAKGEDAVEPDAPTNELYLFNGWDTEFTNITSDKIITATWMLNPDVIYDRESHIGKTFIIEVYSTANQDYTITCNEDIDFTSQNVGFSTIVSDKIYYGKEYEVKVNDAGSYLFYVNGSRSSNTLTYKVKITPHDFEDMWTIDKEATCTEDGLKFRVCSCGEEETAIITTSGHDFSTEWSIDVAPTCTEEGSKSHHCLLCDEKCDVTTIEAFGGNHNYPGTGVVVNKPTYETEGSMKFVCTVCGNEKFEAIPKLEYPTLKQINSQWVYASGNTIITDYTGLVEYCGGYYYVANGILDWNFTGLVEYYGNYYHVNGGYLDWNYSGLSYYYGEWYYVTNGVIDWSYTGLTNYYDAWYYVSSGVLDWNYTGLAEHCGGYYHIANGVLDWNYTGLSYYNGNWYYVTNGVIDWSYTGLTNYYGTWYYVTNGFLDWKVTTLTNYYGTWYYVSGGVLDWNYTGLVIYDGRIYHIANGVLDWNYSGLSNYRSDWLYVTNGVVDFNYTGLTNYYGTWYYVTNGVLDWSVTTLTNYYGTWYYVENGQINWNSNTLCYYGDTWYYVKGGTVAWDYTGWVEYYGGWYYITNGWLDWSRQ